MAVHIVRLGSPRGAREGIRLGTVRRPPRGVPKAHFSSHDWYDVWLPTLSPSAAIVKLGLAAKTDAQWARFTRAYRREMAAPDPRYLLDTLAALSRTADFAVGCYCENEARCHRSILRDLLAERGAVVKSP